MNDAEFSLRYEETLTAIEDAIEESGADIDYETVNDILTLTCPDDSSIIITKQSATHQLWLAAKSGGFHFEWREDDDAWVCTADDQTLAEKLEASCQQQAGTGIGFS